MARIDKDDIVLGFPRAAGGGVKVHGREIGGAGNDEHLEEALFPLPDGRDALPAGADGRPALAVDAAYVHDRLAAIAGDRDLSQYIL